MSKTLQKCVKYTVKELEAYTKSEESCIHKINTKMHLTLPPFALNDMKKSILDRLQKKIGMYDIKMDGILLAVKNIKVLSSTAALRADDPGLHFNINADCYVFKPVEGAILSGTVRHVGKKHIGALIYRVFSVKILLENNIEPDSIELEQEIKIRIRNYNFSNLFPYIEGEILDSHISMPGENTFNKFDDEDSPDDSGIERESSQINGILQNIKSEPQSEVEVTPRKKGRKRINTASSSDEEAVSSQKTKSSKRSKQLNGDSSDVDLGCIKIEPEEVTEQNIFAKPLDEPVEKPKKRKSKTNKINDSPNLSENRLERVKSEPPSESEADSAKKSKKSRKSKIKAEFSDD